jgi:hypothetical protein
MKYVDKHDCLKTVVVIRKADSIEGLHGNPSVFPDQDIDPFDPQVGSLLRNGRCKLSVAAADVQHVAVRRN